MMMTMMWMRIVHQALRQSAPWGELIDIPNPNVDPVCESKADQKLQQLAQQFLLAKSKASKCQGEDVEVAKKLPPPEQPKEPTKKASTPNAALLLSFVSCL